MTKFTDFQIECLHALATLPNGIASADDVAFKLKKKNGRLAVTSAFRSILKKYPTTNPDSCEWIGRIAPENQWCCAKWGLKSNAYKYLGYTLEAGKGWQAPNTLKT